MVWYQIRYRPRFGMMPDLGRNLPDSGNLKSRSRIPRIGPTMRTGQGVSVTVLGLATRLAPGQGPGSQGEWHHRYEPEPEQGRRRRVHRRLRGQGVAPGPQGGDRPPPRRSAQGDPGGQGRPPQGDDRIGPQGGPAQGVRDDPQALARRAPGYRLPDRLRSRVGHPAGPPQVADLAGQQIGGRVRPAPICCVLKFGRLANLAASQIWRALSNLADARI